jgi:hypothetical protein
VDGTVSALAYKADKRQLKSSLHPLDDNLIEPDLFRPLK